jgi:uncharacterized membrane protein
MLAGRPAMIKADPNVVWYRRLRILYSGALIIMVVSFAPLYLTSTHFTPFRDWSFILPFFVLLSFFSFIQQGRYWKGFEQRRIRAAQGDRSLLAEEQPALDEAALSLPLTIQSRTSSPENFFLAMIGVVVITIIIVGFIGFLAGSTSIFSPSNALAFVLGGLAILVLVLVMLVFMIFLVLVLSRTDQRIKLTEQGMTIRQGGRAHTVAWEEARLFAIEGVYGLKKSLSPSMYQLASAKDMLKWTYQRRRSPQRSGLLYRPILAIKPTTSYEEYERQMEALPALVVAKTGLQLYDLRDDRQRGGQQR